MMADDQALQGQPSHLANGSRGRSQLLPYQPHGFTILKRTDTLSINAERSLRHFFDTRAFLKRTFRRARVCF